MSEPDRFEFWRAAERVERLTRLRNRTIADGDASVTACAQNYLTTGAHFPIVRDNAISP